MTSELDPPGIPVIRTLLNVTGLFDPDTFTAAVLLTPTRTVRAGEARSPQLAFTEDAWKIDLGKHEAVHLESEMDRLLALLLPVGERFRETVAVMGLSAEVAFQCSADAGYYPSISLRHDQIKQLAALGLSLDIDII
ncbi:DUF4279 domain-containing protein [Mycobacteroides abscessus]|uniref:DUF4279 domain-containing protein n=1 Tax=Mycobacteroides abscessus subsp. abscessus TaxID=1185650 RepID=A0AB38D5U1_9MYCO|nr:DUF4279 domain-containing protein [Mycobacteroides abscessus]MBE5421494.1 hypothetical protein [Mycobacteroides abscessus]MBE5453785.1 hypothetical protein [Mycobacteroides abscessus]MBN7298063.1 DUF4279 domain-containing protein [Mycobacteroides abscessus subsp. abscessus]MBN7329026.1 DUF4279 domain-containing protein [Mycobacteroides abscessus subsp. abscessus]MBN7330927.1 DUF4279 domain-containing protein [Mycobacteroides abscessus subsp. abscessus]